MGIGIIGHFGGNEKFNDGQAVKTVAIYDALKRYGIKEVDKIDTYYIKKNPFIFVRMFMKGVFKDKKYIVLLSSNGRKILFPVLSFMSRYMKKEVYHYGIGGRLAREVNKKEKWKKVAFAVLGIVKKKMISSRLFNNTFKDSVPPFIAAGIRKVKGT